MLGGNRTPLKTRSLPFTQNSFGGKGIFQLKNRPMKTQHVVYVVAVPPPQEASTP